MAKHNVRVKRCQGSGLPSKDYRSCAHVLIASEARHFGEGCAMPFDAILRFRLQPKLFESVARIRARCAVEAPGIRVPRASAHTNTHTMTH